MWIASSSYDCPPSLCVLWPATILFGFIGKISSRDSIKHQQGKKTLLHTSRERRHCWSWFLSSLLKRHRTCSIGGSGYMQLKYLSCHCFFTFSMKMSLVSHYILGKINMTLESNEYTHKDNKVLKCLKLTMYDWNRKSIKLQLKFYSVSVIFPYPYDVYVYKIMNLLNNSSETIWPVSTKFHVNPTVESRLRVSSNGHAAPALMPLYGIKE